MPAVRTGSTTFLLRCISAALVAVCITLASVSAEAPGPVMFGIADETGIVIPFAMHDAGGWTKPWPADLLDGSGAPPDSTMSLAMAPGSWAGPLEEIPVVWGPLDGGGVDVPVTVDRVAVVHVMCSSRWGLAGEDTPRVPWPGNAYPGTKIYRMDTMKGALHAVATAPVTPVPLSDIPTGSDIATRIAEAVEHLIADAETSREPLIGSSTPIPPDKRAETPVEPTLIRRFDEGPDGSCMYYVEALRDYAAAGLTGKDAANAESFLQCWFHRDRDGGLSLVASDFRYRVHERSLVPLAVVDMDGSPVWVVLDMKYEGIVFRIFEVGPDGLHDLVRVYGGGC